jgi:uncharacterized low-complexity protein
MAMMIFSRGALLALGVLALGFAGPARAQENLDSRKTPAQLFASDCVICHKTTQGLARSAGMLGLDGFLRQHYTASRETAAALSRYILDTDKGPVPQPPRAAKRTAKGSDKDKKPASGDAKSGDSKSGEPKAGEAKVTEPKVTSEPKAAEPKPSEPKAEPKPAEAPKAD